ncbi:hypothetical protein ACQ4PT_057622 [Festuca glaucescens]
MVVAGFVMKIRGGGMTARANGNIAARAPSHRRPRQRDRQPDRRPARSMAVMKTSVVLGLFLLLSVVVHATATETKTVTFDVTQGSYQQFITQGLYTELLRTTVEKTEGLPRLGEQKVGRVPDTWIHAVLKCGAKGALSATLAIRADNIYMTGFKANDGSWFAFKGRAHLLPGANELSFTDDYAGLTGVKRKPFKEMVHVPVGRTATLQAASTLANYKVGGAIKEDEVRKALATMVLSFSEAERFSVIKQNVTALWKSGGTVSEAGIDLLVHWADVSCALIRWNKEKATKKKKAKWSDVPKAKKLEKLGDPKIADAAAAAKNIGLVLAATGCGE